MTCREFAFTPSFEKLEEFLKFYQVQCDLNEAVSISLSLPSSYFTARVGYPSVEENCWLTLRFAIEEMNRSFWSGTTRVQVLIEQGAG